MIMAALGGGRIGFYYLVYETIIDRRGPEVGIEFESLRSLLTVSRAEYLSDQPIDWNPSLPRRFDDGDMMYARAQYALAPVILSRSENSIVVANFADAEKLTRVVASNQFTLIARPTPTVALLRRK